MKHDLSLAFMLGWQDVRQAYRRTAIGPFWLTIGVVVQVLTISVVFGIIFKVELSSYLPFVAAGMVIWGFIASMVNEGTQTFIIAEAMIKQLPLSIWTHVIRVIWRNVIIMGHNFAVVPLAYLLVAKSFSLNSLLFIPGFVLLAANMSWMSAIVGIISSRFRDFPAITSSVMTIVFYVTPVMWEPTNFDSGVAHLLLGLNPFYHLIQITRLPLLGLTPTPENWLVSIALAIVGLAPLIKFGSKFRTKVALWV